jgi:hypothetical protein
MNLDATVSSMSITSIPGDLACDSWTGKQPVHHRPLAVRSPPLRAHWAVIALGLAQFAAHHPGIADKTARKNAAGRP